jgi:hypothetical protein
VTTRQSTDSNESRRVTHTFRASHQRPRNVTPLAAWLVGLSMLACLMGCSSGPQGGAYFRPEAVGGSMGVLYVYQVPRGIGSGSHIEIVVNDTLRASILRGQYVAIPVESGEHFVRARARGSAVRRVVVQPGEGRFLEVVVTGFDERVTIETPTEANARERITQTRRIGLLR